MDALSLIANLIAVAGAASKTAEGFGRILSLRHVPQEILQFINEISDFRAVVAVVEETLTRLDGIENDDKPNEITVHLNKTLKRAAEVLAELNDIIETKIVLNSSLLATQPVKISRGQWLKRRTQVRSLVENVHKARLDLNGSLISLQASEIPSVRANLEGITLHNQDLSTRIQLLESQTVSQISEMQPHLQLIQSTLQDIKTAIPSNLRTEDIGRSSRPNYEIRTSIYGENKCHGLCACRCHQRVNIKSPSWMQSILGHLFVGYHGLPLLSHRSCNEKLCEQQRAYLLTVTYFFPAWFLHRIILFRNVWTPTHGHMINIRTPRVVGDNTSPVFLSASSGNLIGLQSLFANGLASPFDVDFRYGHTPLHRAVTHNQLHVCEFLLSQNADPEALDLRSDSPLDIVFRKIFYAPNRARSLELRRIFGRFLDVDEILQKRNFTGLHKSVLKLSSIPLEAQLGLSTADIDAQCSHGTTALQIAIQRSDSYTVQTLLNFGATFDKAYDEGLTAFHFAASRSVECLRVLLNAASTLGTDGDPRDCLLSKASDSPIPIQIPPSSAMNPQFIHLIEQRNRDGHTPLQWACMRERTGEAARLLLDRGANVDSRHPEEKSTTYQGTPLLSAIQFNNHAALSVLLDRAPDQNLKDNEGMGLLHYLAGTGDKKTFDILLSSGVIRVIGTHDKDNYGHTPLDLFDTDRYLYVTEGTETRSQCKDALMYLINWRDNNPMPGEVLDEQTFNISSSNLEAEVFYDCEEPEEAL